MTRRILHLVVLITLGASACVRVRPNDEVAATMTPADANRARSPHRSIRAWPGAPPAGR
jgi:hypothetical protein